MKRLFLISILIIHLSIGAFAQLTPQDAAQQMKRGINIGNSLDAVPTETSWGNPLIQEHYFDDFVDAGFTSVRIPVTWLYHVSKDAPYTIDEEWMARVDTVVSWGLKRGLFITLNLHHEAGLKATDTMTDLVAKADTLAKYDSIWSQVASHFKDKSDYLLFEILNEPQTMSKASVDSFNVRALSIIRRTNPTRIVLYSGTSYTGSEILISTRIPDMNDKFLMGYYHSYDPWSFAGEAKGTWGTSSDIASMKNRFVQISNWSEKNNIPVLLNECGAVRKCDYNSRMIYYATMVENALAYNVGFNIWDDNGDFQTYIRRSRKWDDAKDVVMYTYKESPTLLKAVPGATTVSLTWTNRTNENDSIRIERKTKNTDFAPIAVLAHDADQYTDSNLTSSTAYYYRLITNLNDSIRLHSYPVTATTLNPTSVSQLEQMSFAIYPNPATTSVKVVIESDKPATLDIYNLIGGRIQSTILNGKESIVSLTGFSKGSYLFTLSSNEGVQTKKVIVQ
jgi:aryl-phospho-beta-D-glucosidase BglC (GH1 family)